MLLYRCSSTLINIIFHIIIILSWCKLEAHHNAIRLVRTKSLNALLLFRTHVWTRRARGFGLKIVLTHSCFSLKKKNLFFFCSSFSSIILLFPCVCISLSICFCMSSFFLPSFHVLNVVLFKRTCQLFSSSWLQMAGIVYLLFFSLCLPCLS